MNMPPGCQSVQVHKEKYLIAIQKDKRCLNLDFSLQLLLEQGIFNF